MQKYFPSQRGYAISSWLNMNSGLALGSVSMKGKLTPTYTLPLINLY